MKRGDFIKTSCSICLAVTAELIFGSLLSSCASISVYETSIHNKRINVPLSLFDKQNFQIIRAGNLKYDIVLEKEKDSNYLAFLLKCTHASTPLNFTGREFVCPLHGSTFNEYGNVERGPATLPLKKYETLVTADSVIIIIS